MGKASLIVGAVLTFASTDGTQLELTISGSETATAALTWGDQVLTSSVARRRHRFGPLPTPTAAPVPYEVRMGAGAPFRAKVRPIPKDGLRIALYGDSRQGHGPHRGLLAAMAKAEPHVVVHTGDVVKQAGEPDEWAAYLANSLPLSAEVPVILALGNHELKRPRDSKMRNVEALAQAMEEVPPPEDPIARKANADIATFHVRLGPALIVSLNSNTKMLEGTPQLRFLNAAVAANRDATFKFVALHHGPASSGRHGPHRHAEDVIAAFERLGIVASLGGHDHTYERIERGPVTYLVSGGGGAPLYKRRHFEAGSAAFASTYNWCLITLEGDRMNLEAYSLEGVLIDRMSRPAHRPGASGAMPWANLLGAAALLVVAALALAGWLVLGRRR